MSPEEMNVEIEALRAEAQELSAKLDAAKEQRTALQKERFDLKEQRRYFRSQLREAKAEGNEDRIDKVNLRLEELEQKLEEVDQKIDAMEDVIDDLGDQMDDISDDLDDIMEDMEHAGDTQDDTIHVEGEVVGGEGQDWGDYLEHTMERLNDLLSRGFKKAADTLENIDFEDSFEDSLSSEVSVTGILFGIEAVCFFDIFFNSATLSSSVSFPATCAFEPRKSSIMLVRSSSVAPRISPGPMHKYGCTESSETIGAGVP